MLDVVAIYVGDTAPSLSIHCKYTFVPSGTAVSPLDIVAGVPLSTIQALPDKVFTALVASVCDLIYPFLIASASITFDLSVTANVLINSFEAIFKDSSSFGDAALNAVANGLLFFCLFANALINSYCNSCSLKFLVSKFKLLITSRACLSETLAAFL